MADSSRDAALKQASAMRNEKAPMEFGYVGIDSILEQMQRKAMKQGFEFNIMVVGQSGLGKSTLINTLFKSKISRKSVQPPSEERIPKTIKIKSITQDIEEKGVRMKLTVIDTPGFGDHINNENCWQPIMKFINEQYEKYLQEEVNINRKKHIPDTRVHCCLYFIPATGHSLRPLDMEFMKRLSKVVNIVPVIAKADTLTLEERVYFKQRITADLLSNGIDVYPQKEFDEDSEDRLVNEKFREMIPFAVVGSDQEYQVNGKRILGRKTKWGTIEVENTTHCEFAYLRDLLIRTHMQNIKDITSSIHFEAYRVKCLSEGSSTLANGLEKEPDAEGPTESPTPQARPLTRLISYHSLRLSPISAPFTHCRFTREGASPLLFTSPRSPDTWLDLGLVVVPGQPLAFLRAGRAGWWAEGKARWIQPPAQVQLPGAREPLSAPCRAGGSVLGPGPGYRVDHWAILCPSGHVPWPLSEAVPRGGQSQQVDLEPLLPLHVMGHDSAPRLPHCLEVASPRLPLPAHEPGAESALSQRPCVSPQARRAAGRRPVVPLSSLCLWVLQCHLVRIEGRRYLHPEFWACPALWWRGEGRSSGGHPAGAGGAFAPVESGLAQMLRLHSCPSSTFTSFAPAQPSLPQRPGYTGGHRAWLLVVLHVPGPLYPRVHFEVPREGETRGQRYREYT
uniref:uncharacterized protein LOC143388601 n=1 Tax=Callospermophilus lateralis TaxID=76772 RepID=UPI004038A792